MSVGVRVTLRGAIARSGSSGNGGRMSESLTMASWGVGEALVATTLRHDKQRAQALPASISQIRLVLRVIPTPVICIVRIAITTDADQWDSVNQKCEGEPEVSCAHPTLIKVVLD